MDEDRGLEKEDLSQIRFMRGKIQEVLSYLSLITSRSTSNPFILARIESEIGLRLDALKIVLMRIDGILEKMLGKGLDLKGFEKEISHWIPILKRFYLVLENLSLIAGPYTDLEVFNLSAKAKKSLSDLTDFLDDIVKKNAH